MMRSLLLLLSLCISVAVNAELTPFFNYRENKKTDIQTRNLQARRNLGINQYGNHGQAHYTVGRYGQKVYADDVYDCESFYSKSHKKDKSSKSDKKEKHYKSEKKCKGTTEKPDYDGKVPDEHQPPQPEDNYENFVRFVMVREESGTPVPYNFGVGDTLALNGQIYFWEDYEDNLMSDVPVGNFVTLCTGVSFDDDLMCTYEIVLGMMTHKDANGNPMRGHAGSIDGVGAFVATGPNYMGENQMIVTGTEFEFSDHQGGTLVTQEDLVNPYLYADLYLL